MLIPSIFAAIGIAIQIANVAQMYKEVQSSPAKGDSTPDTSPDRGSSPRR